MEFLPVSPCHAWPDSLLKCCRTRSVHEIRLRVTHVTAVFVNGIADFQLHSFALAGLHHGKPLAAYLGKRDTRHVQDMILISAAVLAAWVRGRGLLGVDAREDGRASDQNGCIKGSNRAAAGSHTEDSRKASCDSWDDELAAYHSVAAESNYSAYPTEAYHATSHSGGTLQSRTTTSGRSRGPGNKQTAASCARRSP